MILKQEEKSILYNNLKIQYRTNNKVDIKISFYTKYIKYEVDIESITRHL